MSGDFSSKKILIMAFADISGNPRPLRILQLARQLGFSAHAAGFALKGPIDAESFEEIEKPSTKPIQVALRKLFAALYLMIPLETFFTALNNLRWNCTNLEKRLSKRKYDLIVVENLYLLPFALKIKGMAKVIFDAREYYPEQLENFWWRMTERPNRIRICQKYLKPCDAVVTVSPGLQGKYLKEFGVGPVLVRSTPVYADMSPGTMRDCRIRMVHHGVAAPVRALETMIQAFEKLDSRFELDFYLTGDRSYLDNLKTMATRFEKIRFQPPVKFEHIVPTLNGYDLGLCFLKDNTFNLKYSLPNKFFEFIQARLAVVTGPSPDMADLVRHYNCGIAVESFDPDILASRLNGLTPDRILAMKEASHAAAKELCFEQESKKLVALFDELLEEVA